MRDSGLWRGVRTALMRAARPGTHPLEARLDILAGDLESERPGAVWRGGLDGAAVLPDGSIDRPATARMREELAGWMRELRQIRADADPDRDAGGAAFLDLARNLGPLAGANGPEAFALWCERRRAVELGGGPSPHVAVAPFACITAVDPLADGYRAEGLLAPDGRVTFLAARPDAIPMAGAGADVVILTEARLVAWDPRRIASEAARVMDDGGFAWLRGGAHAAIPEPAQRAPAGPGLAEGLRAAGLDEVTAAGAGAAGSFWSRPG